MGVRLWRVVGATAALALGTARVNAQATPRIDVLDYELTIDLPDSGQSIEGRALLTVARRATDTLRLDLLELRVDSVLVDGAPAAFARDSATITVPLPRSRSAAWDTLRVAVRYAGAPRDGLIIRTDSLGRWTGFGDNWPNRGRYWIPSVDHPSDKATVTWIVRHPADRRVVANGLLVDETTVAGSRAGSAGAEHMISRWRESRPIPVYLMVIGAGPLAYVDLGDAACGRTERNGCVALSAYVAPEQRDFLPGPFTHAKEIVDYFSQLVGPFPYEKLAHVQSSTRFGGMENASVIFYADGGFRKRTMGPGVIAHETAHQWFGDAVTEQEWSHVWLSEGFASYFEALWVERFQGDSAFRKEMARLRQEIIAAPEVATRPVIDSTQTNLLALLNTNSYQKGAWTLHMLRALVGDSAFFRGLRAYYQAHRHGTAMTGDLQQALEASAGKPLGWAFDQWLRRPGFAEVRTGWSYDAARHRVTIDIEQGARFAPYRFPLTVEVREAAGGVRRAVVQVAATRTQRIVLAIDVAARPVELRIDPDVRVLASFTTQ